MKMSTIYVMILLTLVFAATYADQLRRIESKLKVLDLKLSANSIEISSLKNEVADTNKKLEVLIEMMNTQSVPSSDTRSTASENRSFPRPLPSPRYIDHMVSSEISRVRRAFAAEKKKLARQQQINNDKFLKLADTLNATVSMINDSADKKYTSAFNSINDSITLALGDVRGNVNHQLNILQGIMEENTNKTQSKLYTLDHVVRTLNDNVHESINRSIIVGQYVVDSINESFNMHDNVTNNAYDFMLSILNKIAGSTDYLSKNIPDMIFDVRKNVLDTIKGAHWRTVERIDVKIKNNADKVNQDLANIESLIELLRKRFGHVSEIILNELLFKQ